MFREEDHRDRIVRFVRFLTRGADCRRLLRGEDFFIGGEPKTERQKERELQRTRETITERQKEQGLQRTRDNRKAESDRERPRRTAFPGRERWQNHSTFRTMQTATELMFIFFSTKTRALFTKSAKENCALFKQMSFVK